MGRNNYLAKQMLGEDAFYGISRMLFSHRDPKDGMYLMNGGFSLVMPEPSGLPESGEWQLTDAEIYVKPLRVEVFRGMKGQTITQALGDYHFANPFGNCRNDDNDCCSCDERGYK